MIQSTTDSTIYTQSDFIKRMSKTLKAIIIGLYFILSLPGPVTQADDPAAIEEKVIIYNWPDYIPARVLEDFTSETGIHVDYSTFDDNEVMYARLKLLKGRGYDVIVASTHLVARMREQGLIRAIDYARLENFKHLDPILLNQSYDPLNKYSVPYLWGSTGIAVNTDKVDIEKITKWEDLWHPQWRDQLLLLDSMREVFHMALKINGDSTNTTDQNAIKQAYQRLRRLLPNVKTMSNNPRQAFLNEEVDIGMMWSGEALAARRQNPAIQYVYPQEGAGFWIESFVIPARASHLENAYKFIDYILRPEVAALLVQELDHATPNRSGRELLEESMRNNRIIFPAPEIMAKAEFQKDVSEVMDLLRLCWQLLKEAQ